MSGTRQNAHVEQVSTRERTGWRRRRPRWAERSPGRRRLYRFGVALLGGLVLVTGVVLIPYPGPGWLIVFAGLAVLATEFHWARRVLTFARRHYDAWLVWLRRRHWLVRLMVYAFTGVVVLVTLWVLGVFGMVGGWFGVTWSWLGSPLFG